MEKYKKAEHISCFNAKTHLSELLANVRVGKEYIITWHNKEIARLLPYTQESDINSTIDKIIENRKKNKIKLSLKEILKFRDEGRR